MPTIYYRRRGSAVTFTDGRTTQTYWYYTTREAYRKFKQLLGIDRAHLVKDEYPITYGFLY